MDVREHWGQVIQHYRKVNDLTQADLADEVGLGTETVASWERGLRSPGPEALYRCVKVLGIPPAELFDIELSFDAGEDADAA